MKTKLFFLGLCCAAAAVSCNHFDDTNVGRGPLTITLTKDDMATKTLLTEKTFGRKEMRFRFYILKILKFPAAVLMINLSLPPEPAQLPEHLPVQAVRSL